MVLPSIHNFLVLCTPVVFNLFAGKEPQENITVARGPLLTKELEVTVNHGIFATSAEPLVEPRLKIAAILWHRIVVGLIMGVGVSIFAKNAYITRSW